MIEAISGADRFVTGRRRRKSSSRIARLLGRPTRPDARVARQKWWNRDKGRVRRRSFSDQRATPARVLIAAESHRHVRTGAETRQEPRMHQRRPRRACQPSRPAALRNDRHHRRRRSDGALGGAQSTRGQEKIEAAHRDAAPVDAFKMMVAQGMSEDRRAPRRSRATCRRSRFHVTGGIATGIFGSMGDRIIAKSFLRRAAERGWKDTAERLSGAALAKIGEEIPIRAPTGRARTEPSATPTQQVSDGRRDQSGASAARFATAASCQARAWAARSLPRRARPNNPRAIDGFIGAKGSSTDKRRRPPGLCPAPGQNKPLAAQRPGSGRATERPTTVFETAASRWKNVQFHRPGGQRRSRTRTRPRQ